MEDKIILTKSGLEKKKSELRELIDVVRPQVIEELAAARAQGDLSENADYDAARNKQRDVEARIKELENIINSAEIIDEGSAKASKVNVGSTVEILDLDDNEKYTYKIVGSVEANPESGLISNECPLGQALIGAKVGDTVRVKAGTEYDVKVVKLSKD